MLAYPQMNRCFPLLLAALAAPAFALAAAPNRLPEGSFGLKLAAHAAHEQCERLDAKERRRYYWKSDGPVDFDILRTVEGKDAAPVLTRPGMRGDGGSFTALTPGTYCWKWVARDSPVLLEGGITK